MRSTFILALTGLALAAAASHQSADLDLDNQQLIAGLHQRVGTGNAPATELAAGIQMKFGGGEDAGELVIFKERWNEKEARMRLASEHGDEPGWRLVPIIVKSEDDLRQEQFASQLINQFHKIFCEAGLPLYLRPYLVVATGADCGFIEAVPDTVSIDSLKKNHPSIQGDLAKFFTHRFGHPGSKSYRRAQMNFVESLAAYAIVTYLLQIKDRHNGNILIDADGHIVHIDFGFMLSSSPGGNAGFEAAPFKLTDEMIVICGGARSAQFRRFRSLCVRAFLVARRQRHQIMLLAEMMANGNDDLGCFSGNTAKTISELAGRFKPDLPTDKCQDFVHGLIDQSLGNWQTRWYDKYQRWAVGIH